MRRERMQSEHETRFNLATLAWPNGPAFVLAARSSLAAPPSVGKEMLGLISWRNFARSGHIDASRSIVGEASRNPGFNAEFLQTSGTIGHRTRAGAVPESPRTYDETRTTAALQSMSGRFVQGAGA
jgi:hypothetical protein